MLAKLESLGLSPAPEADPRTLFRRMHLDITGLPPAPEDVDAFVEDYASAATTRCRDWIDRLMDSPAWGEHRARYWLDAARYGDTHGLHFDNYREMWPYRDWVIRAFNANQPFDQFTVEQIAGDLLPDPTDDQLIATGFQRCNITTNEGGTIDEENLAIYAADRVQTFGWVYLGLTTNCSQCHDHKFDPLTMKDYYSLAAFFRNTTQPAKDGNVKDGRGPGAGGALRGGSAALGGAAGRNRRRQGNSATQRKKSARERLRAVARRRNARVARTTVCRPRDCVVHAAAATKEPGNEVRNPGDMPATFQATGDVTWVADGKLGPAPVMKPGAPSTWANSAISKEISSFSYGGLDQSQDATDVSGGDHRAHGRDRRRIAAGISGSRDESLAVHIIDAWPDNAHQGGDARCRAEARPMAARVRDVRRIGQAGRRSRSTSTANR